MSKAKRQKSADVDDKSLMYLAAFEGNAAVVKGLIQAMKDAGGGEKLAEAPRAEDGVTPLHLAARNGHAPVIKVLLEAKAPASPSRKTDDCTPLHLASQFGHLSAVKALLTAGAAVDGIAAPHSGVRAPHSPPTRQVPTPLWFAVKCGHVAVVKALIEAKANVNGGAKDPVPPLLEAVSQGSIEMVRALLSSPSINVNCVGPRGVTPLTSAIQQDHPKIALAILEFGKDKGGINVNALLDESSTPLHMAARRGHASVVKALIAADASLDVVEEDTKLTALGFAADKGHLEIVRVLVAAGADLNPVGPDTGVPLAAAARGGHESVVKATDPCRAGSLRAVSECLPSLVERRRGNGSLPRRTRKAR